MTDPEPTATGRVRAEVRMHGRRLLAEARAPAAMEALAPRLASDRVVVRGKQAEQAGLCRDDLAAAGRVAELTFESSDDTELRVDVTLPQAEG